MMKKIALIEDNNDVLESTKEILELADYEIVTAENGRKGIELIKKERPDLIFCDVSMPDLDGYTILTILKKHPDTANIPFIFLTARAEKSDMRKGMNLGADDYITKPFEEAELIEAIEARKKRLEDTSSSAEFDISELLPERRGLGDLENLLKDRKSKKYKKKDTIYRFDDFANYVYYITKGKVKSIITDPYSKEFIVDIHGVGEYIGFGSVIEDGDYKETVKALEECEVLVIPKNDFLEVYNQNRDVSSLFTKQILFELRKREERLLLLAYAPVRERLANALLILRSYMSEEDSKPSFVISREDLACIVGTAKESLIRTLSELKSDGIIETDGQKITILDISSLEHLTNV